MKIRIKGNSVRLRLSQNEVNSLVKDHMITDTCSLANSQFVYRIKASDNNEIDVLMSGSELDVHVPMDLLKDWDTDTRVGFDHTLNNGTYVLIEKDFKCLIERTHEDESNLYPNPRA